MQLDHKKVVSHLRYAFFLILSFHLCWAATQPKQDIFQFNWRWKDEHEEALSFSKWKGNPIIIGMAYTSCQMYCPLTIRQLKKVLKEFQTSKKNSPQVVFVTIDPKKDTPKKLLRFKAKWDFPNEQNWHFLSGSEEETQNLAQWLGIQFREIDEHFEHQNKIIVLNENGQITKTLDGWDSVSGDSLH